MPLVLFFIFAVVAVAAALVMITHKNPVYSVLFFVLSLLAFAGFYVLLHAPLVAGVHIVFYSGIIMVVFLFSIMVFGMNSKGTGEARLKTSSIIGLVASIVLLALFISFIKSGVDDMSQSLPMSDDIKSPGDLLFKKYLFPLAITSILLFSAILGSTLLVAKNKLKA